MPNVFLSGKKLPEFRSVVQIGLAVVLHASYEMDGLRAIGEFARPDRPESPIASVYRALWGAM